MKSGGKDRSPPHTVPEALSPSSREFILSGLAFEAGVTAGRRGGRDVSGPKYSSNTVTFEILVEEYALLLTV